MWDRHHSIEGRCAPGAARGAGVLLACVLMLTSVQCGSSEDPPEAQDPDPIMVRGAEATHDFGYVDPESRHTARFAVINDSAKPLVIRKTVSNCSCLTAESVPGAIAPDGRRTVKVVYQSSEKRRRYTGHVMLLTDSAQRPGVQLTITAAVGLSIEPRPAMLEAGVITLGGERVTHVRLTNHADRPIRMLRGTSTRPEACKIGVPQLSIPPGRTLKLPVTIRGRESAGQRTALLRLHTDAPDQPVVEIPVYYRVATERTEAESP